MKLIISLFIAYFMIGTLFLMMFISGYLKLEMHSKKDRKKVGEYRRIYFATLPILAISSIYANKKRKKKGEW